MVGIVSKRLVSFNHFIPHEFARKPRNISLLKKWKATEFTQFLLYTGPLALFGYLPDALYHNFLILHCAIFILVQPRLSLHHDYAGDSLKIFVKHHASIYDSQQVMYNVHNLIHISSDAAKFGHLDACSAFSFQKYMQTIRRFVQGASSCCTAIYGAEKFLDLAYSIFEPWDLCCQ